MNAQPRNRDTQQSREKEAVEIWRPKPFDKLEGEIVAIENVAGNENKIEVVVRTAAGALIAARFGQHVLKWQDARPGDRLDIIFLSKNIRLNGRRWNVYGVNVEKN